MPPKFRMRPADGDDPKLTGRTSPSTKSTGGAIDGRLTRSRANLQAAEKTGPKDPGQDGGPRGKRPRVEDSNGRSKKKHKPAAGGRSQSAGEVELAARPLPPRDPPLPTSDELDDWVIWTNKVRNNRSDRRIGHGDYFSNHPTLKSKVEDPETVESVESLHDRDLVMKVDCSVVRVSSTNPDGSLIFQCSGFVFGYDEACKTAAILTSSLICTSDDNPWHPDQKVSVHLLDGTTVDARLLFFNDHYGISLLEVVTEHPLEPVSFGSRPNYEQEVFVLGRADDCLLVVRHGSILSLERPFLRRNHYMFCSSVGPVASMGGPVVNKHGEVIGMIPSFAPEAPIVASTTVIKCIQMWRRFGRIAHPVHDLDLKTVRMLNILRRSELSARHNIRGGFVVDQVRYESTAEKIGLRRGDVIEVITSSFLTTVPELEDYLLDLSWQLLEEKNDPCSTVLEIQVHNLHDRKTVLTTLPMNFCDATVSPQYD